VWGGYIISRLNMNSNFLLALGLPAILILGNLLCPINASFAVSVYPKLENCFDFRTPVDKTIAVT
jgi:hypothetical protein